MHNVNVNNDADHVRTVTTIETTEATASVDILSRMTIMRSLVL
jgi:hypothetical protein